MRIPADVVKSLKAVAPMRGFTGYQTLKGCGATKLSSISTQRACSPMHSSAVAAPSGCYKRQ